MYDGTLFKAEALKRRSGGMRIMIFKIFSTKRDEPTETDDTGTYADGMFQQYRTGLRANHNDRSSHERDYGADRKITTAPVGFV
jgi:hypothetical protein